MTMQAQERITLQDGTVLNVFLVAPENGANRASPLVILMGGGPGNASISQDTSRWLGSGFAQRGWMVAVPISPNNRSFRGGVNNALITDLITQLQKRQNIAQGKVLLAGVSNGGMSALEIARRNPQDYLGVAAVPAISGADTDNEALRDFPIYLRIGGSDQLDWADRFDETVASLTDAGVVLDADVLDGAPHMFRMEWESLGDWLQEIQK
jgi:dienelactone hydrolase|tara:strand:- start:214 stop:843 length:630 start_codon:yes stop_codon:yes gene_type:complete